MSTADKRVRGYGALLIKTPGARIVQPPTTWTIE
jgi:hypothetical protein